MWRSFFAFARGNGWRGFWAVQRSAGQNLFAKICRRTLRTNQLDSDVVKRHAGIGAHNVREVSGRIMGFAVNQDLVEFGFTGDGVNDVRWTKNYI